MSGDNVGGGGGAKTHRIRWEGKSGKVWHSPPLTERSAKATAASAMRDHEILGYCWSVSAVLDSDHTGPSCCESGERGTP